MLKTQILGITEIIPVPCLIYSKTILYNHSHSHRLKTGHKNDTMSMLPQEAKLKDDFIFERGKQRPFRDNTKPLKCLFLEYEDIPASNKADKAFDLLFEEMVKNNFL